MALTDTLGGCGGSNNSYILQQIKAIEQELLSLHGSFTTGDLTVQQGSHLHNTDINGNLSVTGNTILGDQSTDTTQINGNTNINGNLNLSSTLTSTGRASFQGLLTLLNGLQVSGNSIFNGNINVQEIFCGPDIIFDKPQLATNTCQNAFVIGKLLGTETAALTAIRPAIFFGWNNQGYSLNFIALVTRASMIVLYSKASNYTNITFNIYSRPNGLNTEYFFGVGSTPASAIQGSQLQVAAINAEVLRAGAGSGFTVVHTVTGIPNEGTIVEGITLGSVDMNNLHITGNLTVDGTSVHTGRETFNGGITVTNPVNQPTIFNGTTQFNAPADFNNPVNIDARLTVDGITNDGTLIQNGNTTISGNLTESGTFTATGPTTLNGQTTIQNAEITNGHVASNLDIDGNLNVDGRTDLRGPSQSHSTHTFNGINNTGGLQQSGGASFTGTFNHNNAAAATFTGAGGVTVTQDVRATNLIANNKVQASNAVETLDLTSTGHTTLNTTDSNNKFRANAGIDTNIIYENNTTPHHAWLETNTNNVLIGDDDKTLILKGQTIRPLYSGAGASSEALALLRDTTSAYRNAGRLYTFGATVSDLKVPTAATQMAAVAGPTAADYDFMWFPNSTLTGWTLQGPSGTESVIAYINRITGVPTADITNYVWDFDVENYRSAPVQNWSSTEARYYAEITPHYWDIINLPLQEYRTAADQDIIDATHLNWHSQRPTTGANPDDEISLINSASSFVADAKVAASGTTSPETHTGIIVNTDKSYYIHKEDATALRAPTDDDELVTKGELNTIALDWVKEHSYNNADPTLATIKADLYNEDGHIYSSLTDITKPTPDANLHAETDATLTQYTSQYNKSGATPTDPTISSKVTQRPDGLFYQKGTITDMLAAPIIPDDEVVTMKNIHPIMSEKLDRVVRESSVAQNNRIEFDRNSGAVQGDGQGYTEGWILAHNEAGTQSGEVKVDLLSNSATDIELNLSVTYEDTALTNTNTSATISIDENGAHYLRDGETRTINNEIQRADDVFKKVDKDKTNAANTFAGHADYDTVTAQGMSFNTSIKGDPTRVEMTASSATLAIGDTVKRMQALFSPWLINLPARAATQQEIGLFNAPSGLSDLQLTLVIPALGDPEEEYLTVIATTTGQEAGFGRKHQSDVPFDWDLNPSGSQNDGIEIGAFASGWTDYLSNTSRIEYLIMRDGMNTSAEMNLSMTATGAMAEIHAGQTRLRTELVGAHYDKSTDTATITDAQREIARIEDIDNVYTHIGIEDTKKVSIDHSNNPAGTTTVSSHINHKDTGTDQVTIEEWVKSVPSSTGAESSSIFNIDVANQVGTISSSVTDKDAAGVISSAEIKLNSGIASYSHQGGSTTRPNNEIAVLGDIRQSYNDIMTEVDRVEDESKTRDNTLQFNITKEINDRTLADDNLDVKHTNKENDLQDQINQNKIISDTAEDNLATLISTETQSRIAGDENVWNEVDNNFVHLTGSVTETITGDKTFGSHPTVPGKTNWPTTPKDNEYATEAEIADLISNYEPELDRDLTFDPDITSSSTVTINAAGKVVAHDTGADITIPMVTNLEDQTGVNTLPAIPVSPAVVISQQGFNQQVRNILKYDQTELARLEDDKVNRVNDNRDPTSGDGHVIRVDDYTDIDEITIASENHITGASQQHDYAEIMVETAQTIPYKPEVNGGITSLSFGDMINLIEMTGSPPSPNDWLVYEYRIELEGGGNIMKDPADPTHLIFDEGGGLQHLLFDAGTGTFYPYNFNPPVEVISVHYDDPSPINDAFNIRQPAQNASTTAPVVRIQSRRTGSANESKAIIVDHAGQFLDKQIPSQQIATIGNINDLESVKFGDVELNMTTTNPSNWTGKIDFFDNDNDKNLLDQITIPFAKDNIPGIIIGKALGNTQASKDITTLVANDKVRKFVFQQVGIPGASTGILTLRSDTGESFLLTIRQDGVAPSIYITYNNEEKIYDGASAAWKISELDLYKNWTVLTNTITGMTPGVITTTYRDFSSFGNVHVNSDGSAITDGITDMSTDADNKVDVRHGTNSFGSSIINGFGSVTIQSINTGTESNINETVWDNSARLEEGVYSTGGGSASLIFTSSNAQGTTAASKSIVTNTHFTVPSKTAWPTTPSLTEYATEDQVWQKMRNNIVSASRTNNTITLTELDGDTPTAKQFNLGNPYISQTYSRTYNTLTDTFTKLDSTTTDAITVPMAARYSTTNTQGLAGAIDGPAYEQIYLNKADIASLFGFRFEPLGILKHTTSAAFEAMTIANRQQRVIDELWGTWDAQGNLTTPGTVPTGWTWHDNQAVQASDDHTWIIKGYTGTGTPEWILWDTPAFGIASETVIGVVRDTIHSQYIDISKLSVGNNGPTALRTYHNSDNPPVQTSDWSITFSSSAKIEYTAHVSGTTPVLAKLTVTDSAGGVTIMWDETNGWANTFVDLTTPATGLVNAITGTPEEYLLRAYTTSRIADTDGTVNVNQTTGQMTVNGDIGGSNLGGIIYHTQWI